jgi:hypothetical protein
VGREVTTVLLSEEERGLVADAKAEMFEGLGKPIE